MIAEGLENWADLTEENDREKTLRKFFPVKLTRFEGC